MEGRYRAAEVEERVDREEGGRCGVRRVRMCGVRGVQVDGEVCGGGVRGEGGVEAIVDVQKATAR